MDEPPEISRSQSLPPGCIMEKKELEEATRLDLQRLRAEQEIPAPPPRKPPPLRNSTIAPWVLAARQQDVIQAEEEEAREDDFIGSDEGTPRSGQGSQLSAASMTGSAASMPYSMDSQPPVEPDANYGGVTLSQLEEFLAVRKGMRMACGTLPMTFGIWLAYVFLVMTIGEAEEPFQTAHLIKATLEETVAERPHPLGGSRRFRVDEMEDFDDIPWWIRNALVPTVDPATDAFSASVKIVGFARVVQTKGTVSGCDGLTRNMVNFYPGACYPAALPGTYLGNFGAFDVDDAFQALGPDRPVEYEAWIDSGRPVEEVQSRIDSLIQNNWIDRRTQTVQLDAFFVNLQTTVYVRMKLRIQVYREGLISSELSLVPMRAQVVNHWSHIFLNLCFVILLTVQILSFLQQSHAEYERGLWQLHFWDIWTWLDMLSIVVALVIVFMGIAFMVGTESFTMMVSKLGAMPEWSVLAAPASRKVQSILENRAFRGQCTELLNAVDGVLGLSMWLRFMTAWYAVCLCLRFYRGFTGQPRTAVILQSVMYMTNLFLHYLVVFLVVCGNFALSGYILFGEQVRDWSTFGGSIITLTQVLLGEFDYAAMKNVAPVLALIWWWSFFLTTTVVLSKVLTAAVLQLFLEVRQALGEPGIGLPRQILAVMKNIWHQRSYEGSMKSVPDDDLLKMLAKDLDPAHVKKLMQMKTDRRLCTREDLARAEKDVHVDVEFLVKRGMDPASAERLIDRTSKWALGISTTTSATNRLMLLVAKQMEYLSREVLRIQRKVRHRVDRAAQSADRVDVKHAKCAALAKRLRRAQQIPAGWTAHRDENGRRFLRHEESGLTSWTLPRALV
mmetsp:Transcript_8570/g.17585  ORF Transcript_8570/g.17585 Transcript_8570/m.17585 type:complete len:842 (+) Transcript_8570:79-2604(+)